METRIYVCVYAKAKLSEVRDSSKVWRITTATKSAKARIVTKLGTFSSTTKALLLTWQSLTFYSNRVMAEDIG